MRRRSGRTNQPKRSDARSIDGLKRDDGLDHLAARDNSAAGRQRRWFDLEVRRVNLGDAQKSNVAHIERPDEAMAGRQVEKIVQDAGMLSRPVGYKEIFTTQFQ